MKMEREWLDIDREREAYEYENAQPRKCEYRNCGCDISHMRPNAKYCSRKCKTNEGKYERRRKQFIDKCKANEMKIVEEYKKLQEIIKNNTF